MTKTYQGGCHCKRVRYEATLDLEQPVIECNCSHCQAKGFLLQFLPAESFTLLEGEDALTEYRFNKKAIQHLFCSVCGVQAFAYGEKDGEKMVALNVRSVDGIDLKALARTVVNGKDF